MVETISGTSYPEQMKIKFSNYSVNLIDAADKSVGLKFLLPQNIGRSLNY